MEKMLKEENELKVEIKELVSVKNIDVKYGRNIWRNINEENAWDHKVEAAMVEEPVEKVFCEKVREEIRTMKQEKVA